MVKGNQDVSVQFFVTQDSSSTVIPASNSQPYDLSSSMHVPPRPNFRHQSESRPSFESNASNDNLAEELQTNSEDIAGLSDVEFEGEEEGLSPREQRLDQQVKKTVSSSKLLVD